MGKEGLLGLSQSFHPSIISTLLTASLFIIRHSGRDRDFHYNNFREAAGASVAVEDRREEGVAQGFAFRGTLRGGDRKSVV